MTDIPHWEMKMERRASTLKSHLYSQVVPCKSPYFLFKKQVYNVSSIASFRGLGNLEGFV